MMRIRIHSLLAALLVLAGGQAGLRGEAKAEDVHAPDFKEVYDLIRAHLAGDECGGGQRRGGSAPGEQDYRVRGGHPLRAVRAGR